MSFFQIAVQDIFFWTFNLNYGGYIFPEEYTHSIKILFEFREYQRKNSSLTEYYIMNYRQP